MEVYLTFWPALDEVSSGAATSGAFASFETFYRSLDELHSQLQSCGDVHVSLRDWRDSLKKHFLPPSMAEVLRAVQSSGVFGHVVLTAISFRVLQLAPNILKAWVDSRNGRKIRVKIGPDFEIEASQLSEKQFLRLFEILAARREAKSAARETIDKQSLEGDLSASLAVEGFKVIPPASDSNRVEKEALLRQALRTLMRET